MAGPYQVIVPEAGVNLLSNPSFELGTTGYSAYNSASIAQSAVEAAIGGHSLRVTPQAATANSGVSWTYAATSGVQLTISGWLKGAAGAAYTLQVFNGTTTLTAGIVATGDWQRWEYTFTPSVSATHTFRFVRNTSGTAVAFSLDGLQLEMAPAATTYIDGNQPGCRWEGAWYASTSSRSATWAGGGRIVNFDEFNVTVTSHQGVGAASYSNVATDNGIIGGATFQRSIVQPRSFQLGLRFSSSSPTGLHTDRRALLAALSPNRVRDQQPVMLRYTGGAEPRVIYAHYEGGLDEGATWLSERETVVRFIAYDPYWYAEHEGSKLLKAYDEITDADYVLERDTNGLWHAMAGGLNGTVQDAVYAQDGSLYVGGLFTTAYNAAGTGSSVTVNSIAEWTGLAWEALGSGFSAGVYALALRPDGTLFAGGAFTDATYPRIARWNGSAWSVLTSAGSATGTVYALLYNPFDGYLYIGGDFNNWAGIAGADNLVRWDGSAYSEVSGGANSDVMSLALDRNGDVLVGGLFTAVGAGGATAVNQIARYSIASGAWSSLNADFTGGGLLVAAITVDRAGRIYAGGLWTGTDHPFVAVYNGQTWRALGSGVNGNVYDLALLPDGKILAGGSFTTAGGSTLRDRTAIWTGSAWEPLLLDLPGAALVRAVANNEYTAELALGFDTSGTAVTHTIADTEVVNDGTEDAAPAILFVDAGTVEAIINWTTGKGIYFDNLTIRTGESVWLDLSVLTPQVLPVHHQSPAGRSGPRLWSSARGDITRLILPHSDLASWRLLPGSNTVLVKIRDASPTAVVYVVWKLRYLSHD